MKYMTKVKILKLLLLIFLISTANAGIKNENLLIDTSNYIGAFNDDTKLNSFMIIGSHDSGMGMADHCTLGVQKKNTITQYFDVFEQAESGARYFDIRPDFDHNEWTSFHRTSFLGCNGQRILDILDDAKNFLHQHPSEFIIFKISHTRYNSLVKNFVNEIVLQNDSIQPVLFKSSDKNLNLSEIELKNIRGKLILIFDNEYSELINTTNGIFSYQDIITTGDRLNKNYGVFDIYSNSSSPDVIFLDQLDKLKCYGGLNKETSFLFSWTATAGIGDIEKVTTDLNSSKLLYVLDTIKNDLDVPIPNIFYIDFITKEKSKQILEINKSSKVLKAFYDD